MPEYKNQSQVRPWLLYLGKTCYSTVPLPTIEARSGGSGGRDNKELSDMELVFKPVAANLFHHTCDLYNMIETTTRKVTYHYDSTLYLNIYWELTTPRTWGRRPQSESRVAVLTEVKWQNM